MNPMFAVGTGRPHRVWGGRCYALVELAPMGRHKGGELSRACMWWRQFEGKGICHPGARSVSTTCWSDWLHVVVDMWSERGWKLEMEMLLF